MNLAYSPYAMPVLVAAVLSAFVAMYVWPRRRVDGATPLALIATVIAVWSLGYAFEIMASDLAGKIFWGKSQYIGITFSPYFWLVFAVAYTRQGQIRPWFRLRWLAILPIITTLLAFTTEWHGLIWGDLSMNQQDGFAVLGVEYGAWFWVHFATSYLFLLMGTIILLRGLWQMQGLYRAQIVAMLVATLTPWISNILFFANLSPIPSLDLTPFAFTVTVVALAWAIFGYRLVDIAPIARDLVVDGMREGVVVVNAQRRIVDLNPAAARVIGLSVSQAIGKWAEDVLAPWPHLFDYLATAAEAQDEITIGQGEAQVRYAVGIAPLYDRQKRPMGHIITLREGGQTAVPARPRMVRAEQALGKVEIAAEVDDPAAVWRNPILKAIANFLIPPPREDVEAIVGESLLLSQLLERAFTSMLRFALILGAIALAVVAPSMLGGGVARQVFLSFLAGAGLIALLGLTRGVKFIYRVRLFLFLLYAFAFVEISNYGYSIEAFTFFLTLTALGILLQGMRGGLVIAIVNFGTLAIFGWLIAGRNYQPMAIALQDLAPPVTFEFGLASLLVFAANATMLIVMITILLQSVNRAWWQETQAKNLVQQERDLLDQRVTERTQQLRDSEAYLRSFINSTPAIIVQIDAAYRVLFTHVPGIADTELEAQRGANLFDFVPPEHHEMVRSALQPVFDDGVPVQYESAGFQPRLGQMRQYLTNAAPILEGAQVRSVLLVNTDITEQKEAEVALRRLTQEQKVILDNTAAAIFMQKDRRTVWANPAAERLTGYSLAEAQKLPGVALHATPESYAAFTQFVGEPLDRGERVTTEIQLRRQDDQLRWVEITGQCVNPENPRGDGILWIMQDITERKEAELALQQTVQELERLTAEQKIILDNAATAIFMQKGFQVVWANPATQTLLGYTADEMRDLPTVTYHPSPEAYERTYPIVAPLMDRGELVTAEIQVRHKEGFLRWVIITGQAINPARVREEGILWIMQDITERKEAEQALQQTVQELERLTTEQKIILDNAPAAVFMQKDRSIIWANHATQQILGYTAEEMRHLPNVTYHVSPEAYAEFGERAVAQQAQGGISTSEIQLRHRDGSLRWVYVTGQAINPQRVREDGVLWIMQDISERKQVEAALQAYAEQLALARDQALEASKYKSLLLSKVSHELRTPLGGILGYAELLRDEIAGPLVPDQREFVAYMIEATKHLNSLITDLLDQAQIEQGTVKISPRPVHLPDTLFFLRDLLRPLAAKKGLDFVLEADPDLPENIIADEKRLRQIVINLASNAIKFTEAGMVKVALQRLGSEQWQIEISDSGPGIEPEAQKRIFDSFWQVDGSPSSLYKGYGLGLSIVQQLVVLMGGTIEVSSELGRGSTFVVVLPLVIN